MPVAIGLGWLLLGERLAKPTIAGFALVATGIVVMTRANEAHARTSA